MPALPVRQRLEARIARWLSLLPPRRQVRLSGRPPIRVDGQTLAPDIQLVLAIVERRGRPPYEEMTLPQARRALRLEALVAGGPPPPLPHVADLAVGGAAGPLRARLYSAAPESEPLPLIVFFHGGGFVLGDLDSHDVPCRLLARHAGAHVLSVDYRLAPEHRWPAAVEDGTAALRWAFDHAASLGADPARIAVAGDSAGGNIAAVTAWAAARADERPPVAQLLIYPATDFVAQAPSHRMFDEGFLLVRRDMDWFTAQYAEEVEDKADPRLSIAHAANVAGLAPAVVVTAGFDPLRDEGEAYAGRLRDAGVPVLLRRYPGLIHGFINMAGISPSARDALIELAGATRALLRAG